MDGTFIAVGEIPRNEVAASLGVELDEEGYIKVDRRMTTSVPGVFAAGDIVRGASLVVWAIRDGRDAALQIKKYLQKKLKEDQKVKAA